MNRFRFGVRIIFFTVRVLRHWNRLSRKVVYALSLKCLKARWDDALSHLMLWEMSLPIPRGLDCKLCLKVPSKPKQQGT